VDAPPSVNKDQNVSNTFDPAWPLSETGWGIYAPGLKDLLLYMRDTYPAIPTYVTENGLAVREDEIEDGVHDASRQNYLHDHIDNVGLAIAQGADCKGYFVWSLLDNMEWGSGYQMREFKRRRQVNLFPCCVVSSRSHWSQTLA
jgi:beta-glucosidase/6-phospho-beta-glucosidase/beta-galactosidase